MSFRMKTVAPLPPSLVIDNRCLPNRLNSRRENSQHLRIRSLVRSIITSWLHCPIITTIVTNKSYLSSRSMTRGLSTRYRDLMSKKNNWMMKLMILIRSSKPYSPLNPKIKQDKLMTKETPPAT